MVILPVSKQEALRCKNECYLYTDFFFLMNLLGTSLSEKCIALCNLLFFFYIERVPRGGISIFFYSSTNVNALFCKMIILMSIWDIISKRNPCKFQNFAHLEGTWNFSSNFDAVIFSLNWLGQEIVVVCR